MGKGRFGGGSSSARRMNPDRLLELLDGMSERTRPPSSVTWGRMVVMTCPLLRVTIQVVFVLWTRLKRRVFKLFKPGDIF